MIENIADTSINTNTLWAFLVVPCMLLLLLLLLLFICFVAVTWLKYCRYGVKLYPIKSNYLFCFVIENTVLHCISLVLFIQGKHSKIYIVACILTSTQLKLSKYISNELCLFTHRKWVL